MGGKGVASALPIDFALMYAVTWRMLPLLVLFLDPAAQAQRPDAHGPEWTQDANDLAVAQRSHLWRVGAWGAANVVLGTALLAKSSSPAGRGFGVQAVAWGAINVGIAAVGLRSGPGDPAPELSAMLRAENGYSDILLVNLGLNVGYAGVGGALVLVAARAGIRSADVQSAMRGHGWALVLQGAGLFVLDGVAWLGSRERMSSLLSAIPDVSAAIHPLGWTVTVAL